MQQTDLWVTILRQDGEIRRNHPGAYERLRRCCICLRNACEKPSACEKEHHRRMKALWTKELHAEHERRHPGAEHPDFGDNLGDS